MDKTFDTAIENLWVGALSSVQFKEFLLFLDGKVHVLVSVPGRKREAVDRLAEAHNNLIGGNVG